MKESYWTERYVQNDTPWDLGHASTPIKTYIDQLVDKDLKILIPGAGNAYEARYLAEQGFNDVTVCDISEIPITKIKNEPGTEGLKLIHGDFFKLKGKYDLILEQTFFCAIDRTLREAYVAKMKELLSPTGKLVGVLFATEFSHSGPPHGGTSDEYWSVFGSLFDDVQLQPCYNSILPRKGNELFIIIQNK